MSWFRRRITKPLVIGLFILTMTISTFLPSVNANAGVLDGWYTILSGGWVVSEGYFSNNGLSDTQISNRQNCGFTRCPVLYNQNYAVNALNATYYRGGNTSTAASIARAKQLVVDLRARYNNTVYSTYGPWNRAGSAFIVNTMLGRGIDDPDKSRTITSADWTDLENRLVDRASKNRINWNQDFGTGGQDTFTRVIRNRDGVWRWDVVYDNEMRTDNGLTIRNDDGSVAYRMWYTCANPVGSMSGLPEAPTYDLTPTISGSPSSSEPGGSVSLTPTIRNGDPGTSISVNWQVTRFIVPKNATPRSGGTSALTTNPVAYYNDGNSYSATSIATGTGTFTNSSPALSIGTQTIGDYEVGTKICFGLSVEPYTETSTDWRHSNPFCVIVAKAPKIQVIGGDVWVGRDGDGSIDTSSIRKTVSGTARTYGSWGEYALIAAETISGMASGAGYSNGATTTDICEVSYLTITNAGSTTCSPSTPKGGYTLGGSLPDVGARFSGGSNGGGAINLQSASSGIYTGNANLRLHGGGGNADIASGKWIVINAPTSTVTIDDDIVYDNGPFTRISQIPQVIIIANQINIDGDVTQVDAWLMATGADGRISTCDDYASATQLTESRCDNQLTINGPVAAKEISLYRTAGAGTGSNTGDPAEIFNFRPDAYLWAINFNADNNRLQTVSTKELPPRF